MTARNWIELAIVCVTALILGVWLWRVSKRVRALESGDLVETSGEELPEGNIISGQ